VVYLYAEDGSHKMIGSYLDAPESRKAGQRSSIIGQDGPLDTASYGPSELQSALPGNVTLQNNYNQQGQLSRLAVKEGNQLLLT
jgi:hypothetical protein